MKEISLGVRSFTGTKIFTLRVLDKPINKTIGFLRLVVREEDKYEQKIEIEAAVKLCTNGAISAQTSKNPKSEKWDGQVRWFQYDNNGKMIKWGKKYHISNSQKYQMDEYLKLNDTKIRQELGIEPAPVKEEKPAQENAPINNGKNNAINEDQETMNFIENQM